MSESDAPKELAAKETLALTLLVIVVGGLLFAAFSFITFGVPLLVVAIAGIIWMYVGIMKWVDRAITRRTATRPAEPVAPPASQASPTGGAGGAGRDGDSR